jgi:hypothetical protein
MMTRRQALFIDQPSDRRWRLYSGTNSGARGSFALTAGCRPAAARIHQLNFVRGRAVEEKLAAGTIPTWAYIAVAPLVLWGIVYGTGATRRRIRRPKPVHAKKRKGKRRYRLGGQAFNVFWG